MIDTLRLSERSKDQLVKLRRSTGIKHWNALCRWALCVSLADPRSVGGSRLIADSNVELSWKVLTGEWGNVYLALLQQRAALDGSGTDPKQLSMLLRRHVHRGIELLAGSDKQLTISDLCELTLRPDN
ncbi:DNA sulfur modification protein DndE [Xanthomonas sp. WHRI 10064A]|uniref:DNA sulfur modification protein DndE n=1 Tax=unclassified Xanthomonas TaxID=2643310 RepID=UPI002B23EE2E|nr:MULTISPECIES: DNA sulfur modification protein DndE [unclassified Xanthomonas]MEA9589202.1 DNA sulfur modification protein DndE [Xanthomonas sp. WHRI 10064B]MEA9616875.1 DNA sulfur modification protein DndE [Xanthomonas sp. WHRI 10064A]